MIREHHRIIQTIRKHIHPQKPLACAHKRIRVDESSDPWIIVPTLQIVHPQRRTQEISTVQQWIDPRHPTLCAPDFAEGVVHVRRHDLARPGAADLLDVALEVQHVVECIPVVDHLHGLARLVVDEL